MNSRQIANIEICDKLKEFFSKKENKDLNFEDTIFALKLIIDDLNVPNKNSKETYKQLNISLEEIRLSNEKQSKK